LQISAKAAKPLASAALCFEGGRKTPAKLDADGRGFSVESVLEKSGDYWFELIDRDGVQNNGDDDRLGHRSRARPLLRACAIERPAGNLYVTPAAAAPVRVAVKDDLAIRDISLAVRRKENGREISLPLYVGPSRPAANSSNASDASSGETRTVNYRWTLVPLKLQPGEQVTFIAVASDYLPHVGRSDRGG